jgi:hypothetical protein
VPADHGSLFADDLGALPVRNPTLVIAGLGSRNYRGVSLCDSRASHAYINKRSPAASRPRQHSSLMCRRPVS